MSKRNLTCILLALGALCFLVVLLRVWPQDKPALHWQDPSSGRTVTVTARERQFGMQSSWLEVHDNSGIHKKMLDDDSPIEDLLLVRYSTWLLVVNNHFVLGGYDVERHVLVGENEWGQLPFTLWAGSGTVLAKGGTGRTLSDAPPAGFPRIADPGPAGVTQAPATR